MSWKGSCCGTTEMEVEGYMQAVSCALCWPCLDSSLHLKM